MPSISYYLGVRLLSDATFGSGSGIAGFVDLEIEHDELGCPFISGRTLKGLLAEECDLIRAALGGDQWDREATWLFGDVGSTDTEQRTAIMQVGPAQLPADLHNALARNVECNELRPDQIFASLTGVRRQTAIAEETGAAATGSLRSMRVLLRETPLIAMLTFATEPDQRTRALLAACVLGVRRGGIGRNRGRGRMLMRLHTSVPHEQIDDPQLTLEWFDQFANVVEVS